MREISNGNSFCILDGRVSVILEDIFLGQYHISIYGKEFGNNDRNLGFGPSFLFLSRVLSPSWRNQKRDRHLCCVRGFTRTVEMELSSAGGEGKTGAEILTWFSQDLRF